MSSVENNGSHSRPFLITFSGIDGAGKSTQITHLSSYLQRQQLRVLQLSFWDDVAVWPRLRSGLGQQAVRIYRSSPTQESFSPKNHKHIRRWYLTAVRSGLYVLDALRLRHLLNSTHLRQWDVIIFDRYIYDQLANIYSRSAMSRTYIHALLKQAPNPDLAFIIDTPPAEAFARKREYPLEFMYENRLTFLRLREFCPQLITISGASVEEMESEIQSHLRKSRIEHFSNEEESETPDGRPSNTVSEFP
jgi:thymidylate kinase